VDLVADWHEVDRTPQAPEAPLPLLHLARRRPILREGLQNVGDAVEPWASQAVDRIGQHDDRQGGRLSAYLAQVRSLRRRSDFVRFLKVFCRADDTSGRLTVGSK